MIRSKREAEIARNPPQNRRLWQNRLLPQAHRPSRFGRLPVLHGRLLRQSGRNGQRPTQSDLREHWWGLPALALGQPILQRYAVCF